MNYRSYYAICLAALLAGISAYFIKSISLGPVSQTWMRMTVPTLFSAIWMAFQRVQFFTGNWKKMTAISVLGTVRMLCFLAAYIYTSIGNAVIMFYTYPIFAAILSSIILKEKISNKQRWLLVTAFIGIILAFSHKEFSFGDRDFIGMAASMSSALIYAYTVILFKSESHRYSPVEMIFYQNFTGFILLLPFFEFGAASLKDYTLGITYGVVIGMGVFGLFFFGLKRIEASKAAAIMYLEVITALILGYFWLGETLNLFTAIGGFLIIGSSYLIRVIKD